MIKKIIKAIYIAFITIFLISIILSGWTGYAFISQSSKSNEIIKVIQDMYASQKSVFIDVIDLSKILIKDTSDGISKENNNLLEEKDLDQNFQLDESAIAEENGDNPLGIVIEPSLPQVSSTRLPKIIEEPLDLELNGLSMNEMDTGMDMNS